VELEGCVDGGVTSGDYPDDLFLFQGVAYFNLFKPHFVAIKQKNLPGLRLYSGIFSER